MPQMMKAVVKPDRAPGLRLTTAPVPACGPTDVLVKIRAASICGTDLHIYRWDKWAQGRVKTPVIVGHEVCGEVVERGALATEPNVGDFVSLESHVICNTCQYCRTGRGHICQRTSLIGVDRDGGFAEYIVIPAQNAWVNPPDLPVEVAVLQENFGNAVHTAFAADVTARKVLVTGCGPVGVMCIAVVKAAGARAIYATDVSDYRLELACRAGATLTANPTREDVVEKVRAATGGEGVDVLLEMSGAPPAIEQGFALLKPGGEAALLGVASGPFSFDYNLNIVFKAAKVYGISGRKLWETWYQSRGLVRSGAVDLSWLVTHRFKLEEYDRAFEVMVSGDSGKVVLFP